VGRCCTRHSTLAACALALMMACAATSAVAQTSGPRRMIVDSDPGVDDTVSILLALRSPEVTVEAITVVAGNVALETGARNARVILEQARRTEIPVYAGASRPLLRTPVMARRFHGKNGIGDLTLPDPTMSLRPEHAIDFLVDAIRRSPGQLTIVALGPLTNIALALLKAPAIAPQIKELVFMGGTILSNGNTSPVATFNIYADPEAARVVVNAGIPTVVMVGTDVTTKVRFDAGDLARLARGGDAVGRLAAGVGDYRLKTAQAASGPPQVGFNDLPAMAAAIDRKLFAIERMKVDVETTGELTRGQTVANRTNRVTTWSADGDIVGSQEVAPNVDVAVEVDVAKVRELFLSRVSRADASRD
jgi:purine nucleosidase